MTTIAGIDQSLTSTGIVIVDKGSTVAHKVIETKPCSSDPLDAYQRVSRIVEAVLAMVASHGVTVVRIEGLSFASTGRATRTLAGLHHVIVHELLAHGVDVEVIAPTSLKKRATGSGRASKEDMVAACDATFRAVLAAVPKSRGKYDLADAFHLAHMK
ncbi:hypothetical protein HOP61_13380 [Halomonas daqingensis]|uniref:Holliday junction resolvase RuvC n=1 Tax=Billgrantia desiderata TaxID=52021 RepID=A0AAW4YUC0_9GAMM|nr:crossover junction endodeoxyribonuclease RuvC [Halomonas desiderata]MCE8052297.1 hypothetical protein [Halomonas desiderata]